MQPCSLIQKHRFHPLQPHPLAKQFSECHDSSAVDGDDLPDPGSPFKRTSRSSRNTTLSKVHVMTDSENVLYFLYLAHAMSTTSFTFFIVPSHGSLSPPLQFLPTSRRLVQFSNGRVAPEGARIVYIDGAFDVFHPGHVKILQVASQSPFITLSACWLFFLSISIPVAYFPSLLIFLFT